jgi:hypothetical protein
MIKLQFCSLEWTEWGVTTRFHDGSEVGAWPHDTHHYRVISHRLGYGDDVMAYCREHEFAHAFVAERLRDEPSYVLECLAKGRPIDMSFAIFEEMAAQTFQRWLRANERPILAGVDWDGLKRDALGLLRGA